MQSKFLILWGFIYICMHFSAIKADQWIKALAAEASTSVPHVVQGLYFGLNLV